jgi:hypothetical protein
MRCEVGERDYLWKGIVDIDRRVFFNHASKGRVRIRWWPRLSLGGFYKERTCG